ncbi:MAG: hypothetical protein PWQ84_217 [Thermotogaceae bacterium]|nr:hypothetical protein [Thermotogaceae bacterium]
MKRAFLTTIVILLLISYGYSAPPDVSKQLDIYEEVLAIIELGIMDVDNRGYFYGANTVNRYELAEALFRTRESILGSKAFKEMSGVSTKIVQMESDISSNKVSLGQLRNRLDILEVTLSRDELDAMEQRLIQLKDQVLIQLQTLEDETSFISGYSDFLTAVERELENLYSQVEEQESRLTANEANVSRLIEYLRIYGDLDEWMKKMEAEDQKLHDYDRKTDGDIDGLKKRVENLEFLGQEIKQFRNDMEAASPSLQYAKQIPEINNVLANHDGRISQLEGISTAFNQISQDNDYLKIENDRLKQKMSSIEMQLWYAIGIGVAGAALSAVALVYAFMGD